jgi:hypothetical protein
VSGVCRQSKAVASSIRSHICDSVAGSAVYEGIVPTPIPGLYIGGAVLYKAQRSGVFRPARVIASRRESVTVAFPRCDTERTVPWSTVVVFDAHHVDQPWRPSDGPGATEMTGARPGPPSKATSAVAHTAGSAPNSAILCGFKLTVGLVTWSARTRGGRARARYRTFFNRVKIYKSLKG